MKITNIKNIVLLLTLLSSNAFAQMGNGAGNGGYRSTTGRQIIKNAVESLNGAIKYSKAKTLMDVPSRRDTLLYAINHIDIRPLESRQRDGEELNLDYDLNTGSIIILKGFFSDFNASADVQASAPKVKHLLLHEAAHFFGFNEQQSEDFANEFENGKILHTRIEVDMSVLNEPWIEQRPTSNGKLSELKISTYGYKSPVSQSGNSIVIEEGNSTKFEQVEISVRLCSNTLSTIEIMSKLPTPTIIDHEETITSGSWTNVSQLGPEQMEQGSLSCVIAWFNVFGKH